jgi:hypothetical protein
MSAIFVIIIVSLIYLPIFCYAEKYERSRLAYFFGVLLLTPIITGGYLFFTVRKSKKQGFVPGKLTKKSIFSNFLLSILVLVIGFVIKISSQI